jgi:hypothetical protein
MHVISGQQRYWRPAGNPQRGLLVTLERDLLVQQDVADRHAARAEAQPLGRELTPISSISILMMFCDVPQQMR